MAYRYLIGYQCFVLGSLKWTQCSRRGPTGACGWHSCLHSQEAVGWFMLHLAFTSPCCPDPSEVIQWDLTSQLPQMELVWSCCTCPIGLSDTELCFHLLWELLYTRRLQSTLGDLGGLRANLTSENEAKNRLSASLFFLCPGSLDPLPLWPVGPYFSFPSSCC